MFILLITYAFAATIFGMIFCAYPVVLMVLDLFQGNISYLAFAIIACVGYLMLFPFIYIIYQFISYHYELIEKNMTTLEQLDEKRGNISNVSYDMGSDFNWKFVLGANKFFWWLPLDTGSGAPMGDGVVISKKEVEGDGKKPENEGEFNYDELDEDVNKDWNNDDMNNPLNKHLDTISKNPLKNNLGF